MRSREHPMTYAKNNSDNDPPKKKICFCSLFLSFCVVFSFVFVLSCLLSWYMDYFGTSFSSFINAQIYRHNPWRYPGAAPVADVCGYAGGSPSGQDGYAYMHIYLHSCTIYARANAPNACKRRYMYCMQLLHVCSSPQAGSRRLHKHNLRSSWHESMCNVPSKMHVFVWEKSI